MAALSVGGEQGGSGAGGEEEGGADGAAKKIRNLQKKLRQIKQLREKQEQGGAMSVLCVRRGCGWVGVGGRAQSKPSTARHWQGLVG